MTKSGEAEDAVVFILDALIEKVVPPGGDENTIRENSKILTVSVKDLKRERVVPDISTKKYGAKSRLLF